MRYTILNYFISESKQLFTSSVGINLICILAFCPGIRIPDAGMISNIFGLFVSPFSFFIRFKCNGVNFSSRLGKYEANQSQRTSLWLFNCTVIILHSPHFTSANSTTSLEICISGIVTLAFSRILTVGPFTIFNLHKFN